MMTRHPSPREMKQGPQGFLPVSYFTAKNILTAGLARRIMLKTG